MFLSAYLFKTSYTSFGFLSSIKCFYKVWLNGLCLLQSLRQLWVFFNILFYIPKMFNFEFVTVM